MEQSQPPTPTTAPDPQQELDDILAREDQIEKQMGLMSLLIKDIRTGLWTGPGSVDAVYCAINGGLPTPDYIATFPEGV